MTKELRANLIFLSILVVLIAPGFVILIKKKLGGTAEPNYMPLPVPTSAAYIQPPPIPPGVPRLEPMPVRGWISRILQDRVSPTAAVLRSPNGIHAAVGDRYRSQAVYFGPQGQDQVRAVVFIWDPAVSAGPDSPRLTLKIGDTDVIARERDISIIDVPKIVRRALQDVGYIDPPARVLAVDALFPSPTSGATPTQMQVTITDRSDKVTVETIALK